MLNNIIIVNITKNGLGNCVKSLNPKFVKENLKKTIDKECFMFNLSKRIDVDGRRINHQDVYINSFYLVVKLKKYECIDMISKDFIYILKMFVFCI